MAESFGQVLRRLRKARGMTQDALAEAVGEKQTYLSQIERGKRKSAAAELVAKLARALGDTRGELTKALPKGSKSAAVATTRLQVFGTVPAGPPQPSEPPGPDGDLVDLREEFPAGSVALKVVGRSMEGRGIYDGDWAVVRPTSDTAEVRDGDIVVAMTDGGYTLKAADVRGPHDIRLYAFYEGAEEAPVKPGEDGVELFGVMIRVIGRRFVPPTRKKKR